MIFEQLPESYALALLDLTQGKEKETLEYLIYIQEILKKDKQVEHFFLNPAVSKNLKIQLIKKVFQNHLPELLINFLCILAKNERFNLISEIKEIYQYHLDKRNNILPVKVITAIELDEDTKSLIQKTLNQYYNKEVDIHYVVKSSIIGGIIIQSEGYEIDNSIESMLKQIFKNLKNTKLTGVVYEN